MTRDPVTCDHDTSASEVAALMRDKGVGCVIVMQRRKVVGIITDRQLVTTVTASGLDATLTTADQVMTRHPATVSLRDNVYSVLDTLRSANVARRAPVLDDEGQLVGIVSLSDIAVLTQPLVNALLHEETHHSLHETHVLTGGKHIQRTLHHPSRVDQQSHRSAFRPVTEGTPQPLPHSNPASGAGPDLDHAI